MSEGDAALKTPERDWVAETRAVWQKLTCKPSITIQEREKLIEIAVTAFVRRLSPGLRPWQSRLDQAKYNEQARKQIRKLSKHVDNARKVASDLNEDADYMLKQSAKNKSLADPKADLISDLHRWHDMTIRALGNFAARPTAPGGNQRERQSTAHALARVQTAGKYYRELTGRRPTVIVGRDGVEGGEFYELTCGLFRIAGFKSSESYIIRKAFPPTTRKPRK